MKKLILTLAVLMGCLSNATLADNSSIFGYYSGGTPVAKLVIKTPHNKETAIDRINIYIGTTFSPSPCSNMSLLNDPDLNSLLVSDPAHRHYIKLYGDTDPITSALLKAIYERSDGFVGCIAIGAVYNGIEHKTPPIPIEHDAANGAYQAAAPMPVYTLDITT